MDNNMNNENTNHNGPRKHNKMWVLFALIIVAIILYFVFKHNNNPDSVNTPQENYQQNPSSPNYDNSINNQPAEPSEPDNGK